MTPSVRASLLLAILIATTLAYLPGLSGGFNLDDFGNIVHNRAIQLQTLDWNSLQDAIWSFSGSNFQRPISMGSFALNWYWFGPDPYAFKLTNLLIHLATGMAVYWLMLLFLRAPRAPRPSKFSSNYWLALTITALWLFHPLHISTVLYIYQRMAELGTLFLVLGCASYTLARLRMIERERDWLPAMLASFLLFMPLSLFSKETGLLLPLFTALIEISLFRFQGHGNRTDWRIPAFYGVALIIVLGKLVLSYNDPNNFLTGLLRHFEVREFSLQERLLTQPRVMWFYLKMLLLPDLRDMGLFHDDLPLSHDWWTPPSTLPAIAALAALAAVGIILLRRAPLIGMGILWFFVGHLLESTFVPLEMVYEHRNYLPSIGIAIAVGAAIFRLAERLGKPAVSIVISLLLMATLLLINYHRSNNWQNAIRQHQADVMHHPQSGRALVAAGTAFAKHSNDTNGEDWDTAIAYLQRARSLTPSILPETSLMIYSYASGNPIDPAWFDAALAKLSHRPVSASDVSALYALTEQLSKNKTPILSEKQAITLYETALNHPQSHLLRQRRQNIYHYYGRYLSRNWRKPETATNWLEQRLQTHPDDLIAQMQLVIVYAATNQQAAAREQLLTLIKLDSTDQYPGFIREASQQLLSGAAQPAPSISSSARPAATAGQPTTQ